MFRAATLLLALAAPLSAAAADAPAQVLAPYLEEQTFAVVRVDLARLDLKAALDDLVQTSQVPAPQIQGLEKLLDLNRLNEALQGLAQAGVQDLYLVFSLTDIPDAPFLVVPLPEGAQPEKVRERLQALLAFLPAGWRSEAAEGVLFAGNPRTLKRVQQQRAQARPEAAQALAAVKDAVVQVLWLPPTSLRRTVAEMMPTLPASLGGGSTQVLTQGLRWAALGVNLPPKPSLRLVVQASSPKTAQALQQLLVAAGKVLSKAPAVRELFPEPKVLTDLFQPRITDSEVFLEVSKELPLLLARMSPQLIRLAWQQHNSDSLKHVGIAMHNYASSHNLVFPPVAILSKDGKPLLSWRVLLLPYLDQQQLYQQFHLDEPWDSPHNKKLIAQMPAVYRGSSALLSREGKTPYVVSVGPNNIFTGGREGIHLAKDIPDGTSNTVLLVEADSEHAVPWTKPEDLPFDPEHPAAGLARYPQGLFLVLMADGSVQFLSATAAPKFLRLAFTRNDGEPLPAEVFGGR